ncbi:hypothetical protein Nepgr_020198 [Nepenthes gracilis]|uniref:Uncharacterized protein n=1 Tax=Nepenthes gracilis TaxID=150966 RepID=A0AAD3XUT1_NEPGR|nr:hypothetical protein Nepgr_020198 [Nepenthes gracilis]
MVVREVHGLFHRVQQKTSSPSLHSNSLFCTVTYLRLLVGSTSVHVKKLKLSSGNPVFLVSVVMVRNYDPLYIP